MSVLHHLLYLNIPFLTSASSQLTTWFFFLNICSDLRIINNNFINPINVLSQKYIKEAQIKPPLNFYQAKNLLWPTEHLPLTNNAPSGLSEIIKCRHVCGRVWNKWIWWLCSDHYKWRAVCDFHMGWYTSASNQFVIPQLWNMKVNHNDFCKTHWNSGSFLLQTLDGANPVVQSLFCLWSWIKFLDEISITLIFSL